MKNSRDVIIDYTGRCIFLLLFFASISLFSKTSGKHDLAKTIGNSKIQLHLSDAGAIVPGADSSSIHDLITFHKKSFPFSTGNLFFKPASRYIQFSPQQKDRLSVKEEIFCLFYYHFHSFGEEEPIL